MNTVLKIDSNKTQRVVFQAVVAFYFISLYLLLRNFNVTFERTGFLVMGSFIVITTLISGVLSLIKYDAGSDPKYAFVGFGYLGVSAVSFYYYLAQPQYILGYMATDPAVLLIPIMLLFGYKFQNEVVSAGRTKNKIFLLSMFTSIFLALLVSLYRLPSLFIVLLSICLLLLVIALYFKRGLWVKNYFDQIMITSQIVLVLSIFPYYTGSSQPQDLLFYMSVMVRLVSYVLAMISLLLSVHSAFVLAEKFGRLTEATLTASIKNMPVGYVFFNSKHKATMINDKISEYFGIKDLDEITSVLEKHFSLGNIFMQVKKGSGYAKVEDVSYKDKYFDISASEVVRDGQYLGIILLVEDVTDVKSFEKSKNEFIALASHELRAPLVAVEGNLQNLRDLRPEVFSDNKTAQIMKDIGDSSSKMMSIVNELLDLTEIELGRVKISPEGFSVSEKIESVLSNYRDLASVKKIAVNFRKAEGDLVYADASKTQKVLTNLVDNAFKFTDKGYVMITVDTSGSGLVRVRVRDTGRGIKKQNRRNLFKKFRQVGGNLFRHDSNEGIGLGLFLAKTLAKKMNGDVRFVSSVPNKGSEFEMMLPKAGKLTN